MNFAAPAEVINTPGRWNSYEITVVGDRIVMELNGIPMVDTRDTTHASGPISLQYGAGTVKFRNVKIRRL